MLLVLIAILVVGPRDLPGMMRSLGRSISKLRRTATDLRDQSGIDEILRNENIHREVRDLQKLATGRIMDLGLDEPLIPAASYASRNPTDESADAYTARRSPPRHREYPPGGPDTHDALPEDAAPYHPNDPGLAEVAPPLAADAPADAPAAGSEPALPAAPVVASPIVAPSPVGPVARGSLPDDDSTAAA